MNVPRNVESIKMSKDHFFDISARRWDSATMLKQLKKVSEEMTLLTAYCGLWKFSLSDSKETRTSNEQSNRFFIPISPYK